MVFRIDYSRRAIANLSEFTAFQQRVIADAVDDQLEHEPMKPTRNRKPLRENSLAPWELRVGEVRVFYDVTLDQELVEIVAIGRKVHNRLFIGTEEVQP